MQFRMKICLAVVAVFALTLSEARAQWYDDFDSYVVGPVHGQGPWIHFGGPLPAEVSADVAFSGNHSLKFMTNSDPNAPDGHGSDTWVQYVDQTGLAVLTTGQWTFSYMTYIPTPSDPAGDSWHHSFLEQDSVISGNTEGVALRHSHLSGGIVHHLPWANSGDVPGEPQLPLAFDAWKETRHEIDLDANNVDVYYDNTLLSSAPWDADGWAGAPGLGAWNGWVTGNHEDEMFYFDDFRLVEGFGGGGAQASAPEPTTLVMMLMGLGLGVLTFRRRRADRRFH